MLRKFKKYLMKRSGFLVYFPYYFSSFSNKNHTIPPPFWDWAFILGSYFHCLQKPYAKYCMYWAKKNHLDYIPECCEDHNLEGLSKKHKAEYDYYKA